MARLPFGLQIAACVLYLRAECLDDVREHFALRVDVGIRLPLLQIGEERCVQSGCIDQAVISVALFQERRAEVMPGAAFVHGLESALVLRCRQRMAVDHVPLDLLLRVFVSDVVIILVCVTPTDSGTSVTTASRLIAQQRIASPYLHFSHLNIVDFVHDYRWSISMLNFIDFIFIS